MIDDLSQERLAIQRLFGGGATVTGSLATPRGPGAVEIRHDGRMLGSGSTFTQALQRATVAASGRVSRDGRR